MAADLAGKVALITGVGRPGQIGHAVAEAAGRAGARLVITDRNATALAERERELASRGVAVRAAAADLATPDGARGVVLEARRAFGGLDVVVNVAGGFFYFGPFPEASPEVLDRELTVNLKTAFFMCQAAIPVLVERGGG
ncbi:MAG TPA: SDR family NAD(P)-dependent oxidoreductase, partial [Gemmatimonadales bacterium]|nr:SDR family NAD(P)-dependent oxidoreductase [Gemmatimonadales bacterium]